MALDGELLRKFWSALLTAFPSVTSKPTLVRCRGQCPVFGHKFMRLPPPPPHIPRGSFSRCEHVQLTKVCECACGLTPPFCGQVVLLAFAVAVVTVAAFTLIADLYASMVSG